MRTGSSFQKDLPFFFCWGFLAGAAVLASAPSVAAPSGPAAARPSGCPLDASPWLPRICVAGGSPGVLTSSVIGSSLAPTGDYGSDIRAHSE
jgi:hypothetical protein